jgi:hypothetical protein
MNTGLREVFCVFVSVSVGDTHKGLLEGGKGGVGTDTLTTLTPAPGDAIGGHRAE